MTTGPHLTADGYIRPEADLGNVQPAYAGVPEVAGGLLRAEFGARLHSGYLYGSIARGNAVPGRSDADLAAVLHQPPSQEDRRAAGRVERHLHDRFAALIPTVGVALTHRGEVRADRYGWQVVLRELSVCICGTDLRPELPPTRPSAAVAAAFHADTPQLLARARRTLHAPADHTPEEVQRACRSATRRMVQAAFAVLTARDRAWATVLEEQAAAVAEAFPQWAAAVRAAAEQGRHPAADPAVVAELLDTFGVWVERTLAEVTAEVPADSGGGPASTSPPPR